MEILVHDAGSQLNVVKEEKVDCFNLPRPVPFDEIHRKASNCIRVFTPMTDDLPEISMEAINWAELPKFLLEEILSHLYGEDVRSFHLVCRSWNEAEDCVIQKEHNPLLFPVPQSQWLLHKQCTELICQFIHPVYPNVRYAKNLFEKAEKMDYEAIISRHSKDGWFLMSSSDFSMFFFSPFPKKLVIKLPDLRLPIELNGATFTCPPTPSTNCCVIFCISGLARTYVFIATIHFGKKKWKNNRYANNIPFKPSNSNPVFHKEMFYCLGKEGNLGVYNHKEDTWIVLEKPLSPCKKSYENHLLEHEGGVMSLFVGDSGSWVSVLKLNESDMVWENVYSLGDYALFVSVPTSFATNSVLDMMKNKIFFPLLHNNYPVFYCLETNTFRTYGSNLQEKNLCRTEVAEQIESCWIEPREIHCQEEELNWLNVDETDEETDEETEYETDDESDTGTYDETSEDENESIDESNSEEWAEEDANNDAIEKLQEIE